MVGGRRSAVGRRREWRAAVLGYQAWALRVRTCHVSGFVLLFFVFPPFFRFTRPFFCSCSLLGLRLPRTPGLDPPGRIAVDLVFAVHLRRGPRLDGLHPGVLLLPDRHLVLACIGAP